MSVKKPTIEEISEVQFIELMQKSIDSIEDRINGLMNQHTQFQRLYRDYERDINQYKLRYYIKDGCLTYVKEPLPEQNPIGYKTK